MADKVQVTNTSSQVTVILDGNSADITGGGNATEGTLALLGADGNLRCRLDAKGTFFRLGGRGTAGTVLLYSPDKEINDDSQATIRFEAGVANIVAGGLGQDGTLILANAAGQQLVRLDAHRCALRLGGGGDDARLLLFPKAADPTKDAQANIELNSNLGDIILRNADCAEDFDVDEQALSAAEPGTLMVLDEHGKLKPSAEAYDRRVAGIIAGAGACKPGRARPSSR